MEITASKRQLLDIANRIVERDYVKNRPQILQEVESLLSDIHRDFYTVVVLGEFKRGKSTFVNAILGEPLLPMDILPETAVISAIMYDEAPRLSVVSSDGSEIEGEVSRDYLQKFSAQTAAQSDLASIRYIGGHAGRFGSESTTQRCHVSLPAVCEYCHFFTGCQRAVKKDRKRFYRTTACAFGHNGHHVPGQ